jgi:hypothetical protein
MLQAQSDSLAVSGSQPQGAIVGHWTFGLKASPLEPSELGLMNPAGIHVLTCVWSRQSDLVAETSSARDVRERSQSMFEEGPNNRDERGSLMCCS